MKQGANFSDVRNIKHLSEAGKSAEYISKVLLITKSCVESFMVGEPAKVEVIPDSATKAVDSLFTGPPKIGS